MFLGSYTTRFSGVRRIILPKKFRIELGPSEEIVLTKGLDFGIWGYSKLEWENQAGKHLEIPVNEDKGRLIRRRIFSSAEMTELDTQGRFIISQDLIDFAQIKEEVIIIGAGDHFEIWNLKVWKKQKF